MTKNPLQRQNVPALHHVVTSEGVPENVRQLAGSVYPCPLIGVAER